MEASFQSKQIYQIVLWNILLCFQIIPIKSFLLEYFRRCLLNSLKLISYHFSGIILVAGEIKLKHELLKLWKELICITWNLWLVISSNIHFTGLKTDSFTLLLHIVHLFPLHCLIWAHRQDLGQANYIVTHRKNHVWFMIKCPLSPSIWSIICFGVEWHNVDLMSRIKAKMQTILAFNLSNK